MEFLKFFVDAGLLGGGSEIFAVVLFLIALKEHQRDKNLQAAWLTLLGVLAFGFGSYRAWDTEHAATVDLTAKLHALTVPELVPTFYRGATGLDPKGRTVLFVWIEVINKGAPSVAGAP